MSEKRIYHSVSETGEYTTGSGFFDAATPLFHDMIPNAMFALTFFRFTEVYVEELTDPTELQVLVSDYLKEMALSSLQIEKIVEFYLSVKALSQTSLVDGMGKKPHFSLRTLCRALKISSMNMYGSVNRSLYESFCLSFLTQLDYSSHPVVQSLVAK